MSIKIPPTTTILTDEQIDKYSTVEISNITIECPNCNKSFNLSTFSAHFLLEDHVLYTACPKCGDKLRLNIVTSISVSCNEEE